MIKSSTWNKDSTELLDYESIDLIKANFSTKSESCLIRNSNNVRLINSSQEKEASSSHLLLKITFDSDNFYINCNYNRKEEADNQGKMNYNWGDLSWFIVKLQKTVKGETVIIINYKFFLNTFA